MKTRELFMGEKDAILKLRKGKTLSEIYENLRAWHVPQFVMS